MSQSIYVEHLLKCIGKDGFQFYIYLNGKVRVSLGGNTAGSATLKQVHNHLQPTCYCIVSALISAMTNALIIAQIERTTNHQRAPVTHVEYEPWLFVAQEHLLEPRQ